MSDVKSIQRLLVVQAFYEVSINTVRKGNPTNEIFDDIINNSGLKRNYQIQI